jgi:hypothetical protein
MHNQFQPQFNNHLQQGDNGMQKKLLPLVNQFIYVRQGFFSRYYEGKLVEVTPDTLTLQAYDEEGNEEAVWVMQLSTVTEFMVGDSDLSTLSDKVKMAETRKQLQKLLGFGQQAVVTNPGAPVLFVYW